MTIASIPQGTPLSGGGRALASDLSQVAIALEMVHEP